MPTSFTSYWGSSLHGMNIKWTNDITASPVTLTAEITANYYWRMHMFYDSDVAADLALATELVGTGTVSASNLVTDMKATIDGAPGVDTEHEVIANRDKFKMQFMVANPVSGSSPAFDGFNGRVWVTGKTGTGDGVTKPSVWVEWMASTDGSGSTAHVYDLKPSSFTDETTDSTVDNWVQLSSEAVHTDGAPGSLGTGTNLCKEQWVFSNTSVACVKMTGTTTRDWKASVVSATSNPTNDIVDDFDFDYVNHNIATQMGRDTIGVDSATKVQFAYVVVPFSTFQESETSGAKEAAIEIFAAALALFYAF